MIVISIVLHGKMDTSKVKCTKNNFPVCAFIIRISGCEVKPGNVAAVVAGVVGIGSYMY